GGIAIVQHRHDIDDQTARQEVPHHPAGGGEEEHALTRMHVHVEVKELQLLDGDAAVAVNDRLGKSSRARRKQDPQRMRERNLLELKRVAAWIGTSHDVRPEQGGGRNRRSIARIEIRQMNDVRERVELTDDLANVGATIERLAAVAIAIDAEDQLRCEL